MVASEIPIPSSFTFVSAGAYPQSLNLGSPSEAETVTSYEMGLVVVVSAFTIPGPK